jgi:hypothetical protein
MHTATSPVSIRCTLQQPGQDTTAGPAYVAEIYVFVETVSRAAVCLLTVMIVVAAGHDAALS